MKRTGEHTSDTLVQQLSTAARKASERLVAMQFADLRTARKEFQDIVTNADLESEALLMRELGLIAPHAAFLSEESGASGIEGASERWIIDPLDGTVNFANGLAWFSVTAAYERDGQVLVGIIDAPRADMLAIFAKDGASSINGMPPGVSGNLSLADAVVSICLPSMYTREETVRAAAVIARLAGVCRGIRVLVSGALELALVACGRLDAFISIRADVVSHVTGIELVRAAGGMVTTLAGVPKAIGDSELVASNGHIHEQLLAELQFTQQTTAPSLLLAPDHSPPRVH